MNEVVRRIDVDGLVETPGFEEVPLDDPDAVSRVFRPVGRDVTDQDRHIVALTEERGHQPSPDEPGRPRHENAHAHREDPQG